MGNSAARDAKRILAGERRNAVIAGRNAGKTLQEMADELGISRRRCSQIVHEVLRDLKDESIDLGKEYVRLELAKIEEDEDRADRMIRKRLKMFETRAEDGTDRVAADKDAKVILEAIKVKRSCREERAKYLGLYAAEKRELSGEVKLKGEPTPQDAAKAIREMFGGDIAPDPDNDAGSTDGEPAGDDEK